MKIAIIGGSIAGCALALLLKDKSQVTVFERGHDLQSRGAGITLSVELLQSLINKNLIDRDTPSHSFSTRSFYCQSNEDPVFGKFLWQQNLSMASLHWDTLFTNLRKEYPIKYTSQIVK